MRSINEGLTVITSTMLVILASPFLFLLGIVWIVGWIKVKLVGPRHPDGRGYYTNTRGDLL